METAGGWTVPGEPIDRERWLTPVRRLLAWDTGGRHPAISAACRRVERRRSRDVG